MNRFDFLDTEVVEVAGDSLAMDAEVIDCRPTRRRATRAASPESPPPDAAQKLHEEAQVALIVSLLSLAVPLALPAGLFLGWRVRDRARRTLPPLEEWVSLPFYIATAGLWLGTAAGIFAVGVLLVHWHA